MNSLTGKMGRAQQLFFKYNLMNFLDGERGANSKRHDDHQLAGAER
nr:hypothetical protein [Pseudescherichia vulneris]